MTGPNEVIADEKYAQIAENKSRILQLEGKIAELESIPAPVLSAFGLAYAQLRHGRTDEPCTSHA